jgi:hypothetical protein
LAKFTQSKKTLPVSAKQSRTSPRIASTKSSKTAVTRKTVPVAPRKGDVLPSGKIAAIAAHLRRPKGASIADLMKVTGWQAHSVRGAISASIKKRLGLKVASEKTGTVRLYRIADKPAG